MRTTFINVLIKRATEDKNIHIVTGDLGFGVLQTFIDQLPKQYINAGIAEQNMMAMAGGMAAMGLVPVVYSIGNFPALRCYEQVRNDVCYYDANVKIVCIGGGFTYGSLGMSHHATEDIAVMRALPNMHVFTPSDRLEARFLVNKMFDIKSPVYLRLERDSEKDLHETDCAFEIGVPAVMLKSNAKQAIISYGTIAAVALRVGKRLSAEGNHLDAYSMPCLKPINEEKTLNLLKQYKTIYTLEEHNAIGGLSSIIAELIAKNPVKVKLRSFAIPDCLCSEVGDQEYLRKVNKIDFQSIYEAIKEDEKCE
jgi:transketolase